MPASEPLRAVPRGLTNRGSDKLLQRQGTTTRASIGGYFQLRLPAPYSVPPVSVTDFLTKPSDYNPLVPTNVDLICGDPILELQANAINTLANTQIPGTNTWIAVISWMSDLLAPVKDAYDVVFVDCNPSFSIYTQIALSTVDRIVLPVMADDSSRRAVQNALSLIYGLSLPSDIYTAYAFSSKLTQASRALPKVHMIAKNRITQYMGPASAYAAVLTAIERDIDALLKTHPGLFTFTKCDDGTVEIRDFQTTGVVAFAKGAPFSKLVAGKQNIGGHRVQVKEDYRRDCLKAIDQLVAKL